MYKNIAKLIITGVIGVLTLAANAQTARVQAIHNCPDPGAATVDVWINSNLFLNNISYKEASPYVDAPAGAAFDLSICPSTSTDTTSAIFRKSFTLVSGNTYTVVASGGLAEVGATAFDLRAYGGLEQANNQAVSEVSVNIIHGVYDAPAVDIYDVQVPTGLLAGNVSFGQNLVTYIDLGAIDYDIQVRTLTGVVAAEFDVDLSTLVDSAITVLATGYLDPSTAVGSEPFGLIGVLPNGTVITLPIKTVTPARLQVIHNCAATDAANVDVYLDDAILIDDFGFRTSSAFIDAPAGANFDVSIALSSSTDTVGALFKQTFLLESAKTYIIVASGIVGSGTYSPVTAFSLEVITDARESSSTAGNVDVLVYHGSTDAPTVDVVETQVGAGTIVDNISYTESQGYLDLAATDYDLDITDETGNTVVASFDADISTLGNSAITIVASGFLAPLVNNDGEAFGLYVSLPTGGDLLKLNAIITNSINEKMNVKNIKVYPNPTTDVLQVEDVLTNANYSIIDSRGQVFDTGKLNNNLIINIEGLNGGVYFLNLFNEGEFMRTKFVKF